MHRDGDLSRAASEGRGRRAPQDRVVVRPRTDDGDVQHDGLDSPQPTRARERRDAALPALVAATGGVYQLGPLVTTDLARFEARVAHASRCAPSVAIETLRSALELVRGKPFEGARGYEWAFSESLIANIEAKIADAAHQLATLYLDAGNPQEAIDAAMRGLVAAPADEILYRDRMLACDLAGNPAGVESVMDELCEVVEALEPYDELHPETLALYERISHWSPADASRGQCAVTALLIQDLFGGSLLRAVVSGESHYWNRLPDGTELDLTREQFSHFVVDGVVVERDRSYVLSFPDTAERYALLRALVFEALALQ